MGAIAPLFFCCLSGIWASNLLGSEDLFFSTTLFQNASYAVVTPLHKAASYEPCIAILGIWGDTWLTRGKYGIYVAVTCTGPLWGLRDAFWKVERNFKILPGKISPIYCHVSYVGYPPSLVLCNTWHNVIIRYSYGELPKFVLRCSYEAALRKGVTTALQVCSVL